MDVLFFLPRVRRKIIKSLSYLVLTLASIVLVVATVLHLFLNHPYGQEWVAKKIQQSLANFEQGEIKVQSIKPTSPRSLRIEGLCFYNSQKELAAEAPTIDLQISLMQLLRAKMPLHLVKIPALELNKEALEKCFHETSTSPSSNFTLPSILLSGDTQAEIHHILIKDKDMTTLWHPLSACSRLVWSPISLRFEVNLIEKQEQANQPQLHLHFYHGLSGVKLELQADQIHALSSFSSLAFLKEIEQSQLQLRTETNSTLQQNLFSSKAPYKFKAVAHHKNFQQSFELEGEGAIDLERLHIEQDLYAIAPGLKAQGEVSWNPLELLCAKATVEIQKDETETHSLPLQTEQMELDFFLNTSNWLGKASINAKSIQWQQIAPAQDLKVHLNWLSPSHIFASSEMSWIKHCFKSEMELHRFGSGNIELESVNIYSDELDIHLASMHEKRWRFKGHVGGSLARDIAQELGFENVFIGSLGIEATLTPETDQKVIEGDFVFRVKEAGFNNLTCRLLEAQAKSEIDFQDLDQSALKNLSVCVKHIRQKGRLLIDEVDGSFWGNPKALFYNVHLKKDEQFEGLDSPFDLQSQGFVDLGLLDLLQETSEDRRQVRIGIDKLTGSWSKLEAKLLDPCVLVLGSNNLQIQGFHLDIGQGLWKGWAHIGDNGIQASSEMHEIPADLLEVFTGRSMKGKASGLVELDLRPHQCQAQVDLRLRKLQVSELKADLPPVDGHLKLDWHRNAIQANAKLFNNTEALTCYINGDLRSPASFQDWRDLKGDVDLSLEGRLGLFSYFFTSEDFDFDGKVYGNLHIKGSGHRPVAKGQLLIHNGSYDHYSIGLTLRDAKAQLTGKGSKILLDYLEASDGADGFASAHGELSLLGSSNSHSFLNFKEFRFFNIPSTSIKANGACEFLHKGKGTKLKGEVDLSEVQVRIPDQLPSPVPQLDAYTVVYETDLLELAKPQKEDFFASKIEFDLIAKIPSATVKGRGLDTIWSGEVHLKGDDEEPLLRGRIDMQSGDFNFADKHFVVKEGYLDFAGNLKAESSIHMIAEMMVDQITLRAILNGPLDKPRLQFRSTPNLSTADFFSYLLFSQPHSNLSGFQALQVAQIALEASGESAGGAFSQLRKNTGIDRLEVSSKEALGTDHDGDLYTVKVGKYLTDGFLIGVSKNMSAEGTQITFELDLTKHLSLITEIGYLTSSSINLMWKKEY